MDEVVASSFVFTYVTSNGITLQKEIQFMADGSGHWVPTPKVNLEKE